MNNANLIKAIHDHQTNGFSKRGAADENRIPRTTLKRYFRKGRSQKMQYGSEPELNVKVEKILADWVVEMSKRNMYPGIVMVRLKAFQLIGIDPKEALAYEDDADEKENRTNCSISRSLTSGKAWCQRFVHRNPKAPGVKDQQRNQPKQSDPESVWSC